MYRTLTEIAVIVHLLFIVFVIAGGFFARRWRWLTIVHLSAVFWAIYAELASGVVCPLTTLENYFAQRAGLMTYQEDFVTRYLVPVIYQDGLSPAVQYVMAALVVGVTIFAYARPRKGTANKAPSPGAAPP
jgi:hypothetical protein